MPLSARMIMRAKEGSLYDLYCLQEYYGDYINALSTVYAIDLNGNKVYYLNNEIREELKTCVIEATLKFDIQKKNKKISTNNNRIGDSKK